MKLANWSTDDCPPHSFVYLMVNNGKLNGLLPLHSRLFWFGYDADCNNMFMLFVVDGDTFFFFRFLSDPPSPMENRSHIVYYNTFSEASDEDTFAVLWEIGKVYNTKTIIFFSSMKRVGNYVLFKNLNVRVIFTSVYSFL